MISGSMVALVTPMLPDGDIDWDGFSDLVEWHVVEGTHAIVVVGTTGEASTLSVEEHLKAIQFVNQKVAGRMKVIAGTGSNNTKDAIWMTQAAQSAGVDACLLVTPYYNKPTQHGLIAHFTAIAEACPGDLILYNVPSRTVVDMTNETVLKLAQVSNIIGIKDATGDISRGIELINAAPDGFSVYSGDDPTAIELMLAGAKGNISVTANVRPNLMSKACEAALEKDEATAKALDEKMSDLHRDLFVEANPIPVKWALSRMGKCSEVLRLPLSSLSNKYHAVVKLALEKADL